MSRRSSIWFVVLISVVTIAFIATGCAKKQVVKEEAAAKPMIETKKEEPKAAPAPAPPAPKEEMKAAPAPMAPKEEAKKEAAVPAEKPSIDLTRIWFAFDDYNISNHSKENLEKVANWMSKTPAARIQIQGNTCNIGTAEYNLALGERRASSAKKYLQNLGVSADRLSTISYGLEKPLAPNTNEENRSKNRRDDFVEVK
jgi:peptidoglycan-associated lipoprotein